MKIYKKLLTIQQKINGLGKDKATYNYKYVTGDKLLGEIKPMMNDLGLILKQEVLSIENSRQDYELQQKDGTVKHKSEILSKVMMQFTWIDCETGETDVNLFGANGQNDWEKGLGSALTYAERYFLLKYFHIATDEDDIDNDQRKTSAPVQVKQVQPMLDIARLETRLTACTTLDELGKTYLSFTAAEKQATETLKNELKEKLTPIK
jgi:hypothetical protein